MSRQMVSDGSRRIRVSAIAIIVAVLFLAGAVTLLYPSASSWITQYQQSLIIAEMTDEVEQLPQAGVADELRAAHDYNATLSGEAVVAANSRLPTSEGGGTGETDYQDLLAANETGLIGRLKVPAIDADLPIYHGTNDRVLLKGVGHLEGTALPVGGRSTHSVLTAHRGLASAEMFTRLDAVELGDTFTIEVFGEVLTYRVRETQVVDPSETETLRPVRGEDLVTLVTCTPLGINTQRILVTGERETPTPIEDIEAAGRAPEVPGFPTWAVLLAGAVVISVGYVWFAGRPPRGTRRAAEPTAPETDDVEPAAPETADLEPATL